jgi:Glyoxalase-like domain
MASMKNRISLLNAFFLIAGAGLAAQETSPVLGNGWGLDHVIVAVSGPDVARDIFQTKLGFTPLVSHKSPSMGLQNTLIALPPETYIELVWPYQEPSPDARRISGLVRSKVALGGGPAAYNLDVSPAQQAASAFERMGLRVNLPATPLQVASDGKENRGTWQFVDIDPGDQAAKPTGVPGGPGVGFLEYQSNADRLKPERYKRALELARNFPDPRRPAGEVNANTARRLRSVWVAVPSVSAAVEQANRFGFATLGLRNVKSLGEKGEEVLCGQGTIVFFAPENPHSPLSVLVKKQGLGPFGISLQVNDLKTAHHVVEQGTKSKFKLERDRQRSSFVVPAELAAGTYIEFVQ